MNKSVNLREAAIACHEAGYTIAETAKVFKVGKSTISKWKRRKKETGNLNNKPLNLTYKKINPEKLKAYAKEHPDAIQGNNRRTTAQFAVASIRNWWYSIGIERYPSAKKLLITADGGGSNGGRNRLWKTELNILLSLLDMVICGLIKVFFADDVHLGNPCLLPMEESVSIFLDFSNRLLMKLKE